jgi:D-amino-acid oxidase
MRIRVVGAGIVGLTSARALARAGHEVGIVAAAAAEQTTSSVAAALWYPYRPYPRDEVSRWSARTYGILSALVAHPAAGVAIRVGRDYFRRRVADPWWRPAVPELGRVEARRLPDGYADGYELRVPVIDMGVHLGWLHDELERSGVALRISRVAELSEAFSGADVVVNCTGLGARELAGDSTVTPVRGQVVVVEQFGLTEWRLDRSDPQRLTYVVPRRDCVILGGTAQEGDSDLAPRPETAAAILDRCGALLPEVRSSRVIAHRVGLRPGRPAVRLATEHTPQGWVVHCYGHGGAGVTLAYGCAEGVAALVTGLT